MAKKASGKDRYNFLIDKPTYEDFSMICDELGLVRSKKVENYIRQFVEENKELLKKLRQK